MAYNKAADKEGAPAKRRPMHRRKKVCVFCGKDNVIDYKDTNKLKRYISERGKILPRRITGNTDAVCMRLTKDDRRFRDICPGIFLYGSDISVCGAVLKVFLKFVSDA